MPPRGMLRAFTSQRSLSARHSGDWEWEDHVRATNPVAVSAAMCGALLALAACDDKNAYVPPPPAKVVVAQPLQQPVTRYVEFTGNTQAFNQVDLEARVQGYLEQINYKDGTLQKKDTALFVI